MTAPRYLAVALMRPQAPSKRKYTYWTPQELEALKTYYPNGGTRRAQQHLPKRSKDTIKVMANKLGIKKYPYSPHTFSK